MIFNLFQLFSMALKHVLSIWNGDFELHLPGIAKSSTNTMYVVSFHQGTDSYINLYI